MPPKLADIITDLAEADTRDRIEMLIDFAKALAPVPDHLAELRDAAHRVEECQSPVFLFVEPAADGRVSLHADAPLEAPTVRGFVSLLIAGLQGARASEVLDVPSDLVERARLPEILGMLRVRGLSGVLRRLKAEVARASLAGPSGPASA